MPRKSVGGLKGGRALYRGQNAYASQGFENDTRRTQLGGLVVARLAADVNIPGTSTDTLITFAPYVSRLGSALFLRGFTYKEGTFFCLRGGTYRISLNLRGTVPLNTLISSTIRVTRGADTVNQLLAASNTDAANSGSFYLNSDMLQDLEKGDFIQFYSSASSAYDVRGMTVGTSSAGGLADNYRSYAIVEQIDLPAPA